MPLRSQPGQSEEDERESVQIFVRRISERFQHFFNLINRLQTIKILLIPNKTELHTWSLTLCQIQYSCKDKKSCKYNIFQSGLFANLQNFIYCFFTSPERHTMRVWQRCNSGTFFHVAACNRKLHSPKQATHSTSVDASLSTSKSIALNCRSKHTPKRIIIVSSKRELFGEQRLCRR